MMKSMTSFVAPFFQRSPTYQYCLSRNLRLASNIPIKNTMSSPSRFGLKHLVNTLRCRNGLPRHLSSVSSTTSLSKLLSTSTNYSRRELERLILKGDVTINGKCVEHPIISMDDIEEIKNGGIVVKVKRKPVVVKIEETVPKVWAVNKLFGEIVGEKDPQNRPSMLERLKRGGVGRKEGHLKAVGRLDIPTEGLILVTNDGKFARDLELPQSQIHRVYRARVHGVITENKLTRIRKGFAGFQPMKVEVERRHKKTRGSSNAWVQVTATEGQNRQIRSVFQSLGSKCHSLSHRKSMRN